MTIDAQLQDAARALIESVDHFDPDVEAAIGRRRTGRWWLGLAGACAALVLVVGGISFVGALDGDDTSDQVAASPSSLPSTTVADQIASTVPNTATPTTSPVAVEAAWAPVAEGPLSVVETLATRYGFVTAGFNGVWTSGDGVTWELVAGVPDGLQCEPSGIAEFTGGVVVTGCGPERDGEIALLAWVGRSGESWQQIVVDPGFPAPYAPGPSIVAASPDTVLIAVDTTGYRGLDERGTELWLSGDGITWTRHAPSDTGLVDVALVDIAVIGGGFVATAENRSEGAATTASIWASDDGLSWTKLDDRDSTGRLIEIDDGLILLDGTQTVLTSDGVTWAPWLGVPAELLGLQVTDAAPMGSGIVVSGIRWENSDSTGAVSAEIWRANSAGWSRIPDSDGVMSDAYAWHVASHDDIVVVVGEVPDLDSSDPTDRLERIRTWVWSSI